MPVIKGGAVATVVPAERRQVIAEQLGRELSGETTPNGPVIFELPVLPPDKLDVLVVWDAWEPIPFKDRRAIILEAYKERSGKIVQALGVTYEEAIEDRLLPYAVRAMTREGEADPEAVVKAMMDEGGFARPRGKFDLRFPTMALAEQALRTLVDKLPNGHWALVQSVDSFP